MHAGGGSRTVWLYDALKSLQDPYLFSRLDVKPSYRPDVKPDFQTRIFPANASIIGFAQQVPFSSSHGRPKNLKEKRHKRKLR